MEMLGPDDPPTTKNRQTKNLICFQIAKFFE